jgi:tetratricopeptide (TPR) repeat protein
LISPRFHLARTDTQIPLISLFNNRSHVCWHVYGLIYRSERNYNEAIKAYKQALRIDIGNIQILKDLGLLQIQMRDLDGFTKTQHEILELKPNLKGNWLSFALGKHMQEDPQGAVGVIDTFLSTLEEGSVDLEKNFETSELAMYKNSIIAECGEYKKALDHLDECRKKDIIVDELASLKMKGLYQLQLNRFDDAKDTFYNLFQRGSTEDYSVHTGYMLSMLKIGGATAEKMLKIKGARALTSLLVLTDEQKSSLKEVYQNKLKDAFTKSNAVKRITLTMLKIDSDEWNAAISKYLQPNIKRGMPSLGEDLSALFLIQSSCDEKEYCIAKDPVDIKVNACFKSIVKIVDGYITALEADSTFPDSDEIQAPSSLLWTWYLRATLHEIVGEYSEGIVVADKCLEQTPTGVDLYEQKARLLKGAGDIHAAVECLEKGRQLDLQDRYINNLTTKFCMQADKREEALEKMSLFTRHESDPEQNIFDMQVTWYELELAASYERNNIIGKSLKKYRKFDGSFI